MNFKLSFRNVGLFAFIWLNIGFALGFTVLIGPVRWIADHSRKNNFPESRESFLVKALMLLLVVVSFIIALLLSSRVTKARSRNIKILIPASCLVFGGLALFQLLNPQNLKSFAKQEKDTENKQFVFGSYPTVEELQNFKKEGFSSVISLLHPAVTPFEPILLKEEEENCRKVGLTLISIPMLPWISENEEALNKLKQLAAHPRGKYYVHCYLGKDRVNVVKRLISTYNKSIKIETDQSKGRSLESTTRFERGEITKIRQDVYYIPYPTDEEYTGYILGGGVQQVISLMDSVDNEQKQRITTEKILLSTYHIPFKTLTIRSGKDKKQLADLKKMITTTPKPLVIHRFFSNTAEDLEIIKALKK
jgi:protein tyrosine phosphatase (PTP) superfamily phosphohydrolase (DUF442 family)